MLPRPVLIAHRGAPVYGRNQQNSITAFETALQQGCDGIEFDLRRTACGQAVVCHDRKAGRITVSRATRQQLPKLPDLLEVIRRFGRRAFLDIELKECGLETVVLACLRENPPEREYVVSSFLPEVVLELKARSAVIPVGIICGRPSQLMAWRKLPVEYVIVSHSLLTKRLVRAVHDSGRKIFVWTVNKRGAMIRFSGWEVDGIISDKADLLVRTLGKKEIPDPVSERQLRSAVRSSARINPVAV